MSGTVAAIRRALAQAFAEAGIESPDADARLLVAHGLGLDPASLASVGARVLTIDEGEHVKALAARRLAREPVAYIVGAKEFWSLPLRVTAATLTPRPETETVVEAALAALGPAARGRPLRIADLGTGTGAILLALLSEYPDAFGVGVDISTAALAVARGNARDLKLAGRTVFIAGDFAGALGGGFDLIVSNPPYVAAPDITMLAPEVRDHEPRLALDGGPDGLGAYRAIARDAARVLALGGRLVLEMGAGQEKQIVGVFRDAGLEPTEPARRDLAGVPRALILGRN